MMVVKIEQLTVTEAINFHRMKRLGILNIHSRKYGEKEAIFQHEQNSVGTMPYCDTHLHLETYQHVLEVGDADSVNILFLEKKFRFQFRKCRFSACLCGVP